MFGKLVIVPVALTLLSLVAAADYRLTVNKPPCMSIGNFEKTFEALCPVFKSDEEFRSVYFHRGASGGAHNTTQAQVYCLYNNANGTVQEYTKELTLQLGGSTTIA
ncbi:uncharacterized protein IL334_000056 [Kwoniella shivajii]|uniref:Uncharacterized protein n=1 Tax=Kwoniella shivajii TaxID=564305 RepID=A0ABZ1CN84_9TREE|nr:hypothetical protein IL334_000056 [Kwoniella shivajii]